MPCKNLLASSGLARQSSSKRLLLNHCICFVILALFPLDHFNFSLLNAAIFNRRNYSI